MTANLIDKTAMTSVAIDVLATISSHV